MAIGTSIVRRILGEPERSGRPEPLSEGDRSAALERLRWFGAAAATADQHAASSGGRISMWPR
jgi:hypothetical protein